MAIKKPKWAGSVWLVITVESGAFTLGERNMWKQVLEGPYSVCKGAIKARGYFGTSLDGYGMLGWVVASCQLDSIKGARGKLTIFWEPGGSYATMPLPCDDCRIEPIELYPRTERHPLYNQTTTDTGTNPDISTDMLGLVVGAVHGPTIECRKMAYHQIGVYGDIGNEDDDAQSALGLSLFKKLSRGEETYYLAGQKYTWIYFSYALPALSLGGFVQTPYGPGNVYSALASDLSWLRLADSMEASGVFGSMWKVTRTWLGGPKGHWDSELYPSLA